MASDGDDVQMKLLNYEGRILDEDLVRAGTEIFPKFFGALCRNELRLCRGYDSVVDIDVAAGHHLAGTRNCQNFSMSAFDLCPACSGECTLDDEADVDNTDAQVCRAPTFFASGPVVGHSTITEFLIQEPFGTAEERMLGQSFLLVPNQILFGRSLSWKTCA